MRYLPQNLKYLRQKAFKTQKEFAEMLEVPYKRYQSYEGKTEASLHVITTIAFMFQVSVQDLVYYDLSKQPVEQESKKDILFGKYNTADKNLKAAINLLLGVN